MELTGKCVVRYCFTHVCWGHIVWRKFMLTLLMVPLFPLFSRSFSNIHAVAPLVCDPNLCGLFWQLPTEECSRATADTKQVILLPVASPMQSFYCPDEVYANRTARKLMANEIRFLNCVKYLDSRWEGILKKTYHIKWNIYQQTIALKYIFFTIWR